MGESIIVAILAFLGTCIGAYFANRKSTALLSYRMEQLEEKVDKHNVFLNSVIERTYKLEKDVARLEDEDKRHNERLKALEGTR